MCLTRVIAVQLQYRAQELPGVVLCHPATTCPPLCLLLQPYQNWVFVSVVKGGSTANAMTKALESGWGRQIYGSILIRNIGLTLYKVQQRGTQDTGHSVCMGLFDSCADQQWCQPVVEPATCAGRGSACRQ